MNPKQYDQLLLKAQEDSLNVAKDTDEEDRLLMAQEAVYRSSRETKFSASALLFLLGEELSQKRLEELGVT